MKVLLTGSSGWLGRFLAPELQAAGHHVIGIDVAKGPCTNVIGSVACRATIDRVFAEFGIEAVVHTAALHKPDIVRYPASKFVDVNITGTLNVLEAAVAAGHDRFVFTSTTSLMISDVVRAGKKGGAQAAFWLDEDFGPIRPRNIYGTTKLTAEQLCQLYADRHGLGIAILRTARFFPEDDDTHRVPSGENLKANEFLHRRLTVEDVALAHSIALETAPGLGCEIMILSAPTPFSRDDINELVKDAPGVISRYYPEARDLYAQRGWQFPPHIDRVYDSSKAERVLGFRPQVDFSTILTALATSAPLPYHHDPLYVSPTE